jgi:16S rRNA (guanine527-N7)-methyltransferase
LHRDDFVSRAGPEAPLSPDDFARLANVSRETFSRLKIYADTLAKWQGAINLVAPSTMADMWRRHFLDSAQIYALAPASAKTWIDLGSGAGFPGMVLAIMGAKVMRLVESDRKKCEFLRQVSIATKTAVVIENRRIEEISGLKADVIVSRALAPLPKLMMLAEGFATEESVALFLKGQGVVDELTETAKYWNIRPERIQSLTDSSGVIVRVKGFHRVANAAGSRNGKPGH